MYEVFYNLRAEPFRLSPDHNFCYEHKGYAKARAYMAYAFKRAEGFVMITGRPGTGKTTLIGELVESLSSDKVTTANLVCTQLQADDLLKSVAYSFNIGSSEAGKAELLQRLTVLLNRWNREGRRALLIVDEAQDLSSSAMEELRLLTNIQTGGQPLLQIFLLGQPELRDLILSPEMEQVHQRIVAASHLEGLAPDEVEAYVLHRLQKVGWCGDPALNRAIFPLIHKFSEGVPRRINLICSRLFLLGSVEERHAIDIDDVRVVISELQAENLAAGRGFSPEDFTSDGDTQWLTGPSEDPQEEARPEVRLRAVNTDVSSPGEAPPEPPAPPKKKDPPVVASLPQAAPASEPWAVAEPTSDSPGLDARPVAEPALPEEGLYPQADDGVGAAELAPDVTTPEPPVLEQPRVESPAQSIRGEVPRAAAFRSDRLEPQPSHWRRVLVVVTVLVLVVAIFLFWQIYESRQEEWNHVESYTPPPAEPATEETLLDDLPDIAPLPSEQWETDDGVPRAPAVGSENHPQDPSPGDSIAAPTLTQLTPLEDQQMAGYVGSPGLSTVDAVPGEKAIDTIETDADAVRSAVPAKPEHPIDTATGSVEDQEFSVRFSFDSDELLPGSQDVLDEVVASLRQRPAAVASLTGFADYHGDELYNLELSRKRAVAVRGYLVGAGVEQHRLDVEALGAFAGPGDDRVQDNMERTQQYRIVQIVVSDGAR